MSSKVHVNKPLSSKLIIEILDENPDLEEINCPLSLYERTSEVYLDALGELGITINIIESRGRPKKYDDDLKDMFQTPPYCPVEDSTITVSLNDNGDGTANISTKCEASFDDEKNPHVLSTVS